LNIKVFDFLESSDTAKALLQQV